MKWNPPIQEGLIVTSINQLPNNLITQLKELWQKKQKTFKFIEDYREKFMRSKNIIINRPPLPKTFKDALGDLCEACVELCLINCWDMSEETKIKWHHPESGAAPGRGVDIVCFSKKGVEDHKVGIWIFEVKGISKSGSTDTQCNKIKKHIKRNSHEILRELIELDSWISYISLKNRSLGEFVVNFLLDDPPNIHLSGGIVYHNNLLESDKIKKLKNDIKRFSSDLKAPGLIILFSDQLRKFANSYKNGDVFG